MLKMLLIIGILATTVVGYKIFKAKMMHKYMSIPPIVTVSSTKAKYQEWLPTLKAVGDLRTKFGTDLATEVPGIIHNIYVQSGSQVEKNTVLFELNIDNELAELQSLQAIANLSEIIYTMDLEQYSANVISKTQLDKDFADLASKKANVSAQQAIIAKKKITAPFAGRLGIITASPGQHVNAGEKIVTLQNLDQLFVDFSIPQQQLAKVNIGQIVTLSAEPYSQEKFIGKITSINPKVDPHTRNVMLEAQIDNPGEKLLPGMFVRLAVNLDLAHKYLTLPKTAISFNSYGDLVFVLEHNKSDKPDEQNKTQIVAKQKFVTLGESRGNQIAILSGINEEDEIVTSGQLKLKNGTIVNVNNAVMPDEQANPLIVDE